MKMKKKENEISYDYSYFEKKKEFLLLHSFEDEVKPNFQDYYKKKKKKKENKKEKKKKENQTY